MCTSQFHCFCPYDSGDACELLELRHELHSLYDWCSRISRYSGPSSRYSNGQHPKSEPISFCSSLFEFTVACSIFFPTSESNGLPWKKSLIDWAAFSTDSPTCLTAVFNWSVIFVLLLAIVAEKCSKISRQQRSRKFNTHLFCGRSKNGRKIERVQH